MHGMLLLNEFADGFSYISDLNIYIYVVILLWSNWQRFVWFVWARIIGYVV
jgi:hypothetical protein